MEGSFIQPAWKLKALAALQGKSIKEFILDRTLGAKGGEAAALAELEALLDRRLRSAQAGGISHRTVGDILEHVVREAPADDPDA